MRFLALILTSLLFSGCIDEAESKAEPAQTTDTTTASEAMIPQKICQENAFPATTPLKTQHPLCQHYYLFDTALEVESSPKAALCMVRWQRNAAPLEGYEKADILQAHYMMGRHFALLHLLEGDHQLKQEVQTKTELDRLTLRIKTGEAAMAIAILKGSLGREFDASAFCNAKLTSDATGWTLTHANVFAKNCAPRESRDIHIDHQGKVTLLKSTIDENAPALCVD